MPYTNAEKQKRARDRAKAKMERYEAALREIATGYYGSAAIIAKSALQD